MLVNDSEMERYIKVSQSSKAPQPIRVTESGMNNEVNELHRLKAQSPMEVTEGEI